MAQLITTTTAILELLNGAGNAEPWHLAPDYYAVSIAQVNKFNSIDRTNSSVALKAFVNHQSGEVKFYIAKWVDTSAATLLP